MNEGKLPGVAGRQVKEEVDPPDAAKKNGEDGGGERKEKVDDGNRYRTSRMTAAAAAISEVAEGDETGLERIVWSPKIATLKEVCLNPANSLFSKCLTILSSKSNFRACSLKFPLHKRPMS